MPGPTPDYSAAPRKRFVSINLGALPFTTPLGDPFVLYVSATAVDGTATLGFTPGEGAAVTAVPVFYQGKFDLALMTSLNAVANISAAWAAF
jgi:hypothetical protein